MLKVWPISISFNISSSKLWISYKSTKSTTHDHVVLQNGATFYNFKHGAYSVIKCDKLLLKVSSTQSLICTSLQLDYQNDVVYSDYDFILTKKVSVLEIKNMWVIESDEIDHQRIELLKERYDQLDTHSTAFLIDSKHSFMHSICIPNK